VYVSECGSKNRFRGISVAREPKWDRNRASRELEGAPLGAKMAPQYMLRLTFAACSGCSGRAQAELRHAQGMLTLGSG